jgi:hypothetical protein
MSSPTMDVRASMWWLAGIWFAGAGLLFVILVGQSLFDYYEPRTPEAWGWFLPTVTPTLSLIVGALVAEYRKTPTPGASGAAPVAGMFRLAAGLSVFYLIVVSASVLLQPVLSETAPLTLMQRSSLWLAPLQGLCVAALGFFFQSRA